MIQVVPAARPADDVAAEIRSAGFFVNNCFEIPGGAWQANLRRETPTGVVGYSFALGMTMTEALESAFHKARVEIGEKFVAKHAAPVPELPADMADLV